MGRSQEVGQLDASVGSEAKELFFVGLCICFISEVDFLWSFMERMQKPRDILNCLALFLSKSQNPLIAQNSRERLCVPKPESPVNYQPLWLLRSFLELHQSQCLCGRFQYSCLFQSCTLWQCLKIIHGLVRKKIGGCGDKTDSTHF